VPSFRKCICMKKRERRLCRVVWSPSTFHH